MPKFTMKDVDKQIEEIRARHKPQVGGDLLTQFRDIAKKRKTGVTPPVVNRGVE